MKLQPGKYYKHEAGRCIYVAGMVKTFKWNEMAVIEETDATGHSISCVEMSCANVDDTEWVEIGKEEWMKEFNGVLIS
jgi:hypothetical protein